MGIDINTIRDPRQRARYEEAIQNENRSSQRQFSELHRQRMSVAQKERANRPGERETRSQNTKDWIAREGHPQGFKGHKRTEEEKESISKAASSMWADPNHTVNSAEHRQMLSDHCSKIASNRTASNSFSRTKKGFRQDIGISCRSSWEANYARYLNWIIANDPNSKFASWEYEAETFWFESIRRGCRSWKPDFKVRLKNGQFEYHEVKGWMYPRARTALRRMRIYHPTIVVVLIDESRYKSLSKTVGKFIKGWE